MATGCISQIWGFSETQVRWEATTYTGRDFSPFDSTESLVLGYDFCNDVNVTAGEVITSVSGNQWTLSVSDRSPATDPNPSSHLIGNAVIVVPDGATSNIGVTQRIAGLLPDVIYIAVCTVSTNQSNTYTLWSHIPGEAID